MVGIITLFGYTYWKIDDAFGRANPDDPNIKMENLEHNSPPIFMGSEEEASQTFALAIIGTDNRAGSGGTLNSDVIIVAIIDQVQHQVHLLSIPRDTKIHVPGYSGYRKANAAFALGEAKRRQQERNKVEITETGPFLVKKMLSEYLEIPIQHYVHLDFKGFEEVVDAVNGVQVDVKRSMEYDSKDGTYIRLSKGVQILNGKNALDYVRFRLDNRGLNYQSSDFERNERQHEVIRAIIDKLTSFEGVTSLYSVLDAVADNTKSNIGKEKMKGLVWDFKSFSRENIFTINNEAYWDSKQAYTIIPEERIKELRIELQEMFIKE